ncbi:MAG: hypothetical protein M2R45_04795 [Verrucomicrobia subdivision 3 bacterium]|nr:hypothetical protein [Limisphaerales bacterium]MCS1417440.1 hypothetical protein [Limisphaerales bacterium]
MSRWYWDRPPCCTVEVRGSESLAYQWFFENRNLPDKGESSLRFEGIGLEDAVFEVEVTGSLPLSFSGFLRIGVSPMSMAPS